jgi:hypothetical protein
MGNRWVIFDLQLGNVVQKPLTHFAYVVEYRSISMSSFSWFESKSKRKPNFAASVVEFGLVLVDQEKDKFL